MRYIKKFEDIKKHIPKFEIGDPVKIKGNDTIYVVDGHDYDYENIKSRIKNVCRLKRYEDKDKLASYEGFYIWVKETKLIKAKKYEIDAQKYNL